MKHRVVKVNNQKIMEVISDKIEIKNLDDSLDIMGNASYEGIKGIAIYEKNFDPVFFDLKSRLAGDILQKYSNYQMKLAIIGNFEKYNSKSLAAFIIECNRGSHIFFVSDFESAIEKLTNS